MVLIALAIVFGGLGAMSLSSADSDDSQAEASSASSSTSAAAQGPAGNAAVPTSASAPAGDTSSTTTTSAKPGSASPAHSVPVRVLNNSMVAGLAGKTADQLARSGWTVAETGNYGGSNLPKTTVYYGDAPGAEEAAKGIADELGADVEPTSEAIGDSSPGVTVIVTGR